MPTMESNYMTLTRDEWLACRKGRFTSSDCYRLFNKGSRPMTQEELDGRERNGKRGGLTDKRTSVEITFGDPALGYIREKLDELLSGNPNGEEEKYPSLSELKQTEWGSSYEWDGLRYFEVITSKSIIYYGGTSPRFFFYGDYSGCSPDGEIVLEDAAVEMKCPYDTDVHTMRLLYKTVDDFKKKEFKEWCQCQCIMKITGKSSMYFCSYDPRKTHKFLQMKIVKLKADLEWQKDFDFRLLEAIKVMREMLNDTEKYLRIEE